MQLRQSKTPHLVFLFLTVILVGLDYLPVPTANMTYRLQKFGVKEAVGGEQVRYISYDESMDYLKICKDYLAPNNGTMVLHLNNEDLFHNWNCKLPYLAMHVGGGSCPQPGKGLGE